MWCLQTSCCLWTCTGSYIGEGGVNSVWAPIPVPQPPRRGEIRPTAQPRCEKVCDSSRHRPDTRLVPNACESFPGLFQELGEIRKHAKGCEAAAGFGNLRRAL